MNDLLIPFAIDSEENIYNPKNAPKDKKYYCLVCGELVILKKGSVKISHFAHKVSDTCNQETIIHKTAKLLIHKVIKEWKLGKSACPTIERKCFICRKVIVQALPEKVEKGLLEYRLIDGFVADVALMVKDVPQALVEIFVTHKVDEIKAKKLTIPYIELDGFQVVDNPLSWQPITDKFNPVTCHECRSLYNKFLELTKRIAQASKIELPNSYYRYGLCRCWKCNRKIIVFTWVRGKASQNIAPKKQPIPYTLQYRYSKTAGHNYWANTCPFCNSIQGDFFLYNEDGPFFYVYCEEDTPTAYENDMLMIFRNSCNLGFV